MNKSFQYQTLSEPLVSGVVDIPTIDKFDPIIPRGRMWEKIGLSLAILAGSYFAPAQMAGGVTDQAGSLSLYGTRQFQFQTLAEPTTVPTAAPFNPYIDKYLPNYPDQFLKTRGQTAAIQAGSLFYIRYFPKIETVTLDKWRGEYPDALARRPIFPAPSQMASIRGEIPLAETVTADKWAPTLPHISFQRPTLTPAILAGSTFRDSGPVTGIPRLERWIPSYPDYYYKKGVLIAAIQAGTHSWCPRELEAVRPDKWIPTYPDLIFPVRGFPRHAQQAITIQLDPTFTAITADKWGPRFPDYIFRKINREYPYLFWTPATITPVVLPDKIQSTYPDLLLPSKRIISAIQAGSIFLGDVSRPTGIMIYVWRRIA